MRQIGAAISPLVEEMFDDLGLDREWHNLHYTPGLLLARCNNIFTDLVCWKSLGYWLTPAI